LWWGVKEEVMMQAKDIPEEPILALLKSRPGVWHTWWDTDSATMPNVKDAMPPEAPEKVRLAKMRSLVKRGLVKGCPCGCRGDFHIDTFAEPK
jgi:hypothetical protein